MAQSDLVLANVGFPTARAKINEMTEALATLSAGATEPATTYPYQWWADTTAGLLKQRNGTNTAWVSVAPLAAGVLPLAGGTMTGQVTLPTNGSPAAAHAARVDYVNTQRDTRLPLAGGTMTGFITLHANPTNALHAATKQYVDSISVTPTTAQVLAATAGATAGDVGTYAWAATINNNTRTTFGGTLAGSSLQTQGIRYWTVEAGVVAVSSGTTTLSGTWRCMGTKPNAEGAGSTSDRREATIWLRIS
jgi:hypothetical protein